MEKKAGGTTRFELSGPMDPVIEALNRQFDDKAEIRQVYDAESDSGMNQKSN